MALQVGPPSTEWGRLPGERCGRRSRKGTSRARTNGTWIVFDLLGHIYRLPAAGGAAECLTQASGVALNSRRWDGLYRISLEGKEEKLVEAPAEWPSPSRDGRFLYFYALRPIQDSNEIRGDLADGRKLRRLDLATGQAEDVPVAALPGGALAPQISPDGRRLAFARRVSGGTPTAAGWPSRRSTGSG